jgi:hypothetical protein
MTEIDDLPRGGTRPAALRRLLNKPDAKVKALGDNRFECEGEEYMILTDLEADSKCYDAVTDSLWSFRPSFILDHVSGVDNTVELQNALADMQDRLCDNSNALIKVMIDDLYDFVNDAVAADGRGHFLAFYDCIEHQEGEYFIYRV